MISALVILPFITKMEKFQLQISIDSDSRELNLPMDIRPQAAVRPVDICWWPAATPWKTHRQENLNLELHIWAKCSKEVGIVPEYSGNIRIGYSIRCYFSILKKFFETFQFCFQNFIFLISFLLIKIKSVN